MHADCLDELESASDVALGERTMDVSGEEAFHDKLWIVDGDFMQNSAKFNGSDERVIRLFAAEIAEKIQLFDPHFVCQLDSCRA